MPSFALHLFCLVLQIVGEDAGGAFDFGGAGACLVVFGGTGGGNVAVGGFLVAFKAEDLCTDEAAVFFF